VPRRVLRTRAPEFTAEDGPVRRGVHALRRDLEVTSRFPDDVRAEAEDAARRPRLPDLDRTDIPFVTVDPPGARDLDQALHLERLGDGFRVHYAIADVAAFVAPDGALDAETHRRGETLYDVGGKVPLHPPVLSEGACSLLPDGERPALLWTIDLDASGERTAVRVERARVRSRAQLTYDGLQADLDAGRADPALELLREVGLLRLERERERGGVSLPLPDQEVERHGERWRLALCSPLPVEGWNAQISLLTGMAAASLMTEARVGVLRTLPPADPRDLARLRRVARALGVPWPDDVGYPDLIRSLDPSRPAHAALLTASTRLLRGSGYAAFEGTLPEQPLHAAIASTYTHCTAPLRRLVDRYAGEVCVAICAGEEVPDWVRRALPGLPDTMQGSSRRAGAYERGVLDLVEAVVLEGHVGDRFEGVVVEVDEKDPDHGQVLLTDPAVEAKVRAAADHPLELGTRTAVRLLEADVERRTVHFETG
jgi:exoribonuclease R